MFKISIQPEEIEKMPLGSFPGEIRVIEKTGIEYAKAIAYLMSQKVIGFDTETRPVFSPGMPHRHTALLQLSGPDKAFLFRIQKLGMKRLLCSILSNPNILKIGAATYDDVRGLQYYSQFEGKGFVDLQKIGYEWGIRDKSVKKMAAIILGCRISKTQQLSNWEAESLSASQQMYAATDAWICREMYMKLLQSEKHPLTPEQLNPPQQPKQDKPQEAKPEKSAESVPESAGEVKKKTARKKVRKSVKKSVRNDQDNTEERS